MNQPKGRPGISDDLPGRFLRVRPDGISARRRRPAWHKARKENPQGKNFKVWLFPPAQGAKRRKAYSVREQEPPPKTQNFEQCG